MKKLIDLEWFIENNIDDSDSSRIEFYEPPIYVVKPHEDDTLFAYVQDIYKKAKREKQDTKI